ncbi:Transmembrane amino acid transporter protein [Leishmania braziliensis]|nr:Transmembrane amino acid transporter protein [Leishmania braziliensis]
MHHNGSSDAAEEGNDHLSPASISSVVVSSPSIPLSPLPMTPTEPNTTVAAEQERQLLYSCLPPTPPLGHLARAVDETDGSSSATGASAARRCFHTPPLKEMGQDKVAKGFHRALPTTPQSKSAAEPTMNGADDHTNSATTPRRGKSDTVLPTTDRNREAPYYLSSDSSNEDGNHNVGRPRRDEGRSNNDLNYTPTARLTVEEEQAARLCAYNEMVAGSGAGDEGEGADGVVAANSRDFISDTVHTILPTAITRWFSLSANAVAQTSSSMVPNSVKSATSTVAHTIGTGAQHIGDAIDTLPDLMVKAIPPAVMSKDVKQLLFTDFSNTFRSFFHTNILTMPFVFRQAGLVGGIVLLSFVAVTSEYATEAYFGAKNQMKNAHRVVVYGDVPLMVWGDWYPMINLFYGITHLIGFIAFSSSNAVVLLGAMGMKGGGARALGLIIPSLIALPLVLMKNARSQQPLAIMSNILVLNSVILMCIDFTYKPQPPIKLWANSPSEFFVALGVTVYAFTGIGSTISVERVMAPERYHKLLRASVAISWALLMAFGLSGFLSYGNRTCSVMTVSLQSGPLRTAASALLFVASLAIIPQNTFPLCELSDRRVLGITQLTQYWDLKPNLLRIAYLVLSSFAAFTVPYYGLILSISGSLGCGIVGLVVPAALDYVRRERWALREGRTLRFWEYFVIFGLGLYGCVVVVIGVVSGSYQLWRSIQTSSTDSC